MAEEILQTFLYTFFMLKQELAMGNFFQDENDLFGYLIYLPTEPTICCHGFMLRYFITKVFIQAIKWLIHCSQCFNGQKLFVSWT